MKVKPATRINSIQEYYFSTKLRQIEQMRQEGADVINLGVGSPDRPPSENTIDRLAVEARKPNAHGYQSYIGSPLLRQALAGWYKKYFKVELDPESEILPLIGSKEGIMHISMAFVDPGDEVLIPDPGYPTYEAVTRLVGGKVRLYDLKEENNWYPDINAIEKNDLSNVKLMWTNYPNMPTGAKASPKLFNDLVSFSRQNGILLVNDNPYSFILNNDYLSILSSKGAMETVLELNSLSKSHNMAGWRIGMAGGNAEYIRNILKVKSNMDSGMFLPLQLAATEALNNPESWYETINSAYAERRLIAESIMEILGCRFDKKQSGMFLWGKIRDNVANGELFVEEILKKTHVFITPGFIFGKNGDRYVRISLCTDNKRLKEARERISRLSKI